MNRVAITGMGAVSALGIGTSVTAAALRAGTSGVRPIMGAPTDRLAVKVGAEVPHFEPGEYFNEKRISQLDRYSQLGLIAAREAIAASGLEFKGALGARTAAIVGSGVGGMGTLDDNFRRLYAENVHHFHPLTIPRMMISAAVSHITMENGIKGPAFTIASACASANHAIGVAFQMVRSGMVDVAVSGGTESVFTPGTLKAWEAMRILAPDTCRPFSRGRKGLVLGEGAGMLVLENFDHARARGALILGEIAGFGMSADAGDIVLPSLDGAASAMKNCLADGGLAPGEIDYINAHGTGTMMNDVTETRAIRAVFGGHADKLAVSSTKSLHGHALGAAGAIELVATLLAMRGGFIPPTVNFLEADPECDLDYVPNQAREGRIGVALSNSFAFGGLNAVLAVRSAS
ncbi:MAG TPA: beta-ketoacyl-[acyl-carrier-protein] synthase family protein [Rhizomicrobium sp.]|nr:beta-ketoacyl-[acyl-carrier-protein] synthase family protein [Rhizomicrobium sp.]